MRIASEEGDPIMRLLCYEFPADAQAWEVEDEYMYGHRYLVCPILFPGARARKVYLPAGAKWGRVLFSDSLKASEHLPRGWSDSRGRGAPGRHAGVRAVQTGKRDAGVRAVRPCGVSALRAQKSDPSRNSDARSNLFVLGLGPACHETREIHAGQGGSEARARSTTHTPPNSESSPQFCDFKSFQVPKASVLSL
ncbi:hypothetical protein L1887_62300 [Cichorium endivia]|nr:hypothetical protein L1887_62300 [Cichorium endivia]